MRSTTARTLVAGAVALGLSALPLSGQSTGPAHAGFDPNASSEGHFHEGELGEKYLMLEQSLKCDCGCGLDVHSCQFQMQCGTSPVWSQRIRASLEQGESVEAIEASFVSDFGATVLMSPPAEGFNLLGYLLPAFAILSAGVVVGLLVRGGTGPALAPVERVTDHDAARLQEALRKLDEAESPDW